MSNVVTATLDANDEVCGPIAVRTGATCEYDVVITSTITVTLQRKLAATWVDVEDGYTANATKTIQSPGLYRLIASATSGGSADCSMREFTRGD